MGHIKSWKNSKTLLSQFACDELEKKEGKYSSESIESYFTLFELLLASKSNPLLAVEELHFAKQGSMTSGEFHSHIVNPSFANSSCTTKVTHYIIHKYM